MDQMSARCRAIMGIEYILTETAAMPEIGLPVPAYVGDPMLNIKQGIKYLLDTVTWFHSRVQDLTAYQSRHAQALCVARR